MRHKALAFYRPSAVVIARAILDIPLIFLQTTVFTIIVYFLAQLSRTGGQFMIYWLFVYLCVYSMTQLYRMFAAWLGTFDDAIRFAGLAILITFFYTGYIVTRMALIDNSPWFGWLYCNFLCYIANLDTNPLAYAFEAVMANQFEGQDWRCDPSQIVPSGPSYNNSLFQSCAIAGATSGSTIVSGGAYISQAYGFSRAHIWRNFGIMFIFIIAYIILGMIGSEYMTFGGSGAATLQFTKTKRTKNVALEMNKVDDLEMQRRASTTLKIQEEYEKKDISLTTSDAIFTWSDLSYEIPYGNGSRKLLNNLWGWCKPGELTALMGASGAGKTTLLNTLSQRQTVGVITGDMLVDGKELGIEFRRGTGLFLSKSD
jgi:ATP-binding cassette, subfamily G (WHITE), member 2, SNQ2